MKKMAFGLIGFFILNASFSHAATSGGDISFLKAQQKAVLELVQEKSKRLIEMELSLKILDEQGAKKKKKSDGFLKNRALLKRDQSVISNQLKSLKRQNDELSLKISRLRPKTK